MFAKHINTSFKKLLFRAR